MNVQQFTYSLILLLSIAYPLAQSFEWRVQLWKKWKYIFPALLITSIPFILWDIYFANYGIWSFNPDYVLGIYFFKLPLEECLFFIIIPYACFFMYEVLFYYFPRQKNPWFIFLLHGFLIIVLLIVLLFNYMKLYSMVALVVAVLVLGVVGRIKTLQPLLTRFYVCFLVSILPFLLVNGYLTSQGIVQYNDSQTFGIRILSIPFEDVIYLLSLLFMNLGIYEVLKSKHFSA